MKELHLICNAHLDPMWQWEWEEGAAATVSTFRCAADFCEEFDGFLFNHNEAVLYRWIEEYEPALFERIRRLVLQGKWHIMGGWYLQPDCNMPAGESILRQIEAGRRYFKEKFGISPPATAVNLDPFGHSRGLVQILTKTGYENYLFMRPDPEVFHLESPEFWWEGYDGSHILAHHIWAGYGNDSGCAAPKIEAYLRTHPDFQGAAAVLWGVGDHGGGPSRKDLTDIAEFAERMRAEDIAVIHSTPEAYFAQRRTDLAKTGESLPVYAGHLRTAMPGCYTTQIRLKQLHRRMEALLFSVEKMAGNAHMAGICPYPDEELQEAQRDLMLAQFHDVLPGSSVENVEEAGIRTLHHGMEILYRIRARLFFAMSRELPSTPDGCIPLIAYNPHPYTVEGDFSCEFTLANHNFSEEFLYIPKVYDGDTLVASQLEKEAPNTNFDWRKRVVFHAALPPFTIHRFICRLEKQDSEPHNPSIWRTKPVIADIFAQRPDPLAPVVMKNDHLELVWDPHQGGLCRIRTEGNEIVQNAPVIEAYDDIPDSWGMNQFRNDRFREAFRLAAPDEAARIAGLDKPLAPLRLIEQGEVRQVVEAIYICGQSWAVVQWALPTHANEVDCVIRLFAQEPDTLYLFHIPTVFTQGNYYGQDVFGRSALPQDGSEQTHQIWCSLAQEGKMMAVINDGIYASHAQNGHLYLTLLRTPAYCSHQLLDHMLIPQDRFTPRVDRGGHVYHFRFVFGDEDEQMSSLERRALSFQEKPMLLSFFPAGGDGTVPVCPVKLPEDCPVILTSLAKVRDGYRIRLFNPSSSRQCFSLSSPLFQTACSLCLEPYEIVAWLLNGNGLVPTGLVED